MTDLLKELKELYLLYSLKNIVNNHNSNHDEKGRFCKSGSIEKGSVRSKIDSSKYKTVELPKDEYAAVMHELNTNLTKEQRKEKQITRAIRNSVYTIENNSFNEYRIIDKYELD